MQFSLSLYNAHAQTDEQTNKQIEILLSTNPAGPTPAHTKLPHIQQRIGGGGCSVDECQTRVSEYFFAVENFKA